MDQMHAAAASDSKDSRQARRRRPLPLVSNDERAFWLRAVEIERRRLRCGRPAAFPFQPA